MKALQASVVDGIHKLKVEEVPTPTLKLNTVLVKIIAAAVNPSDVTNSKGGFPHTTFPRTLGRDFAGVVVKPQDSHLYGKAVFGTSGHDFSFSEDGAHAEYALVSVTSVALKPANISFAQAASIGTPFTSAWLALRRTYTTAKDTVMVLGATGAVGTAATQLAEQMGCKVLTVSRRDTSSINLQIDPDLHMAKDLSYGKGPDVAIDTVGDLHLLHSALASLAIGGRLSVISVTRSSSAEMPVNMKVLYRSEHSIVGCNSVSSAYTMEGMAGWLTEMVPMFEKGELKPSPEEAFIKVKLEHAVEAYEGKKHGAKYVIVME